MSIENGFNFPAGWHFHPHEYFFISPPLLFSSIARRYTNVKGNKNNVILLCSCKTAVTFHYRGGCLLGKLKWPVWSKEISLYSTLSKKVLEKSQLLLISPRGGEVTVTGSQSVSIPKGAILHHRETVSAWYDCFESPI